MSDDEQTAMIRETVARFVDRELIPLEPHYLQSKLPGAGHTGLTDAQRQRLRDVSKELGLWGLDAPEDLGGHDLPTRTMAAVHEELGRTCVPFVLPPDRTCACCRRSAPRRRRRNICSPISRAA
jgi:alkylation response protein AidB-like acyl-CoA dehydrogenase